MQSDWSTFCFLLSKITLLWFWSCSPPSWFFGLLFSGRGGEIGGIYCRRVAVCLAMDGTFAF